MELLRLRLAGAGNSSHVEFEMAVDGKDAGGLGVMSQGEVNALALSVFLPRATSERSPLRFLVIDDRSEICLICHSRSDQAWEPPVTPGWWSRI